MQATYKTDRATFNVTFYDGDNEMLGSCGWEIKLGDIAKIYAENNFKLDYFDDSDRFVEFNPETDDPDVSYWNMSADALIVVLAAASQMETPHQFDLDYHGEPYWFFHDTVHAEYDSGDGTDVYINEYSEMRALPMGAERAARAGASIADILRELANARVEFTDRFGFKFDPISAFLESVELVIK